MDRIKIFERDLTTNGSAPSITDVVYIPGFSSVKYTIDETTGATTGIPRFTPKYCNTVSDFELFFGTNPARFEADQVYPVLRSSESIITAHGFPDYAIPGEIKETEEGLVVPVWKNAGDIDMSYVYAKELLNAGIPVLYERVNEYGTIEEAEEEYARLHPEKYPIGTEWDKDALREDALTIYDVTIAQMYDAFNTIYSTTVDETTGLFDNKRLDRNEYSIKYLTSGAYPVFEYDNILFENLMAEFCQIRGDAVAFIDHLDNPDRDLSPTATRSVYSIANSYKLSTVNDRDSYATIITPWIGVTFSKGYKSISEGQNYTTVVSSNMPGSYAYLTSLAQSIKTNPNWMAVAGVQRGHIVNCNYLHTRDVLTQTIAEAYQQDPLDGVGVSINPITKINPYGYCIWGNRTLKDKQNSRIGFATEFLNIRNLVSDVKKQVYVAAQSLMFEPNTDILWINFKALVTPLLNQMVSGQGLANYKIIKNQSNDKTKLSATIKLYPIYSVESFEVTIVLSDEDVVIEEGE